MSRLTSTQHPNVNKLILVRHFNVCRIIVVLGFLAATILTMAVQAHMSDPDDWAYYFGAKNFSQGQFVVDTQTHQQQVSQAQQQGRSTDPVRQHR